MRRRSTVVRPTTGSTRTLIVVTVVGVMLMLATARPARAQTFVAGAATADATTFSLALKAGASTVGLAWGSSSTSYRENYAASAANPLDLQLVRVLLGEPSRCPGSTDPVPLPDSALPPTFTTNSLAPTAGAVVEGDADFPGFYGAPPLAPVGHGKAYAAKGPHATATTTTPNIDMGLFSVLNPSTSTESALQGQVRTATATSRADRITFLSGALVIENPTWKATVRSGAATTREGSFTVTGGTLFGYPRTAAEAMSDLGGAAELVRTLLGYVGLSLELPKVKVEGDLVAVSPLQLQLMDSPLAKDIIAPLMDTKWGGGPSFNESLVQGLDEWATQSCDNKRFRQIIEILLGLLRGTGGIVLPIGGVTVTTDATPPPTFQQLTTNTLAPAPPVTAPIEPVDTTGFDDSGAFADVLPAVYDDEAEVAADVQEESFAGPEGSEDDVIEFASPIVGQTRTIDGETGGAGVLLGATLIALAGAAIVSERVLKTRRLRRLDL